MRSHFFPDSVHQPSIELTLNSAIGLPSAFTRRRSFATDEKFLGAAIVFGTGEKAAIKQAAKLGIKPRGGVLVWPVGKKHLRKILHVRRLELAAAL